MAITGIKYKEELVTRIRDLIDGYDSSSLLKEYLQNADDSGATELIITFDKRDHSKLHGTKFEFANSPALLLSNDSIFREKDFESIVKISSQGKVEDALSTGRFGQGFSSSFSISDHPGFISNDRAYWFDVRKNSVSKDLDDDILFWDKESFSDIDIWLDTFKNSGLDSALNKKGTIFRLPLRTMEQVETDDGVLNKISDEVFTYENFLHWCDEWKDKAENLLFLRSIHKLVLQEIDSNGNKIVHLSIETRNHHDIQKINKSIKSELEGSLIDICNTWNDTDKKLPVSTYKQHFIITYLPRDEETVIETKEDWAVVNGLFRGYDNILISQALKSLNISPNPRKVLPWAGAAVRLNEEQLPVKNKKNQWYTFLPLPIESKQPVQLHGWFDLNPKRTEITSGGSGYDKETLTKWNELLLEHGLGPAWAMLIDYIKSEKALNEYYSFWPKSQGGNSLEKYLAKGFYSTISKLESFYVEIKDEKYWAKPATNTFLFQDDNPILHKAFREHFQIIIPKPTNEIIKGLKNVKLDLPEINPNYIRDYIKDSTQSISYPVSLNNIGINMLSIKEWFLPIAHYCADNGNDYSKLDNLPFQLALNGKVSLVNSTDVVFGQNVDLDLLQNKKELILDFELANEMNTIDSMPRSWLPLNLKNVITLIWSHFDEFDLNMNWIDIFVKFIHEHRKEKHNVSTMLSELDIVFQEDGQWGKLKNDVINDSPIFIKEKDIPYLNILHDIGLNTVNHNYLTIYEPLAEDNLIAKFSPYTLSKYLLSIEDHSFFMNKEAREYIIDILTMDSSWYDKLNIQKRQKIDRIPFIHTVSDDICALSYAKLFISTSFNPPKHISGLKSDYDLIDTTNPKHLELYRKMGIKEQTPDIYIKEVIIPFLENSPDEKACLNVLGWISVEWNTISSYLDLEVKYTLIDLLKKSKIIPSQDNFTKKRANEIYDPIFSYELPGCLNDSKYQVIAFQEHNEQVAWKNFLEVLNLKKEIFAEHIIYKVNQIVNDNIDVDSYKNSIEKSVCLANYMVENIEYFDELVYQNKPLFEALKQYAWLPTKHPKNFLIKPDKTYLPLMHGNELVRSSDAKIISGVHYILSDHIKFSNKDSKLETRDIAHKFGIVVNLKLEDVLENFRKLIILGKTIEDENRLIEYVKEFYAYLGRKHKLTTDEIPRDIRNQAIRINGQWIQVSRVFKRQIRLRGVYSWKPLVGDPDHIDNEVAKGLELLGVKQEPDLSLFVDLLNELPIEEILSEDDLKQAKTLLKAITRIDELDNENILILTNENKLVYWEDMYINDLPAYDQAKNKNTDFYFCHEEFRKLANKLGVDSLAACHEPKLNSELTIFNDEVENFSAEIDKYIKHKYFKEALLRLLYHEDQITNEEINEDTLVGILSLEVISVNKLVVDYFVYSKFLFSDENITTYEDKNAETLYILEQDDAEDMIESIVKFISTLFDLSNDNTFIIQRIIREKMDQNEIRDHLNKKHIKSLPKELDLTDEDESIFDDEDIYTSFDDSNDLDNDTNDEDEGEVARETDLKNDEDEEEVATEADLDNDEDQSDNRQDDHENESKPSNKEEKSSSDIEEMDEVEPSKDTDIAPPTIPKKPKGKDLIEGEDDSGGLGGNVNGPNRKKGNPPGSGKGMGGPTNNDSDNPLISRNDRKPVYVGPEFPDEKNNERSDEDTKLATEIGNKGENLILERDDLKLSKENYFQKAPRNNAGFDIVEKNSNEEIVRYIEVKTLTGKWGQGGVALTPTQLKYAMNAHDKWWLLVVEGIHTDNAVVYQFKNPVLEANKFMFDDGWKQLAIKPQSMEPDDIKANNPEVGEFYIVNEKGNNVKYEITNVKKRGALILVEAKREGETSSRKIKFNKEWGKCNG